MNATAPRTAPLHDLAARLRALDEALEETDGELTESMEAALDALPGLFESKVEALCREVRRRRALAEEARAEAQRCQARARAFDRAADGLADYVTRAMDAAGVARVKTALVTAWPQAASRPSIRWGGSPGQIPPGFRKVVTEVKEDSDATYEAWKAGTLPEGFTVSLSRSLRIR